MCGGGQYGRLGTVTRLYSALAGGIWFCDRIRKQKIVYPIYTPTVLCMYLWDPTNFLAESFALAGGYEKRPDSVFRVFLCI